MEKSIVKSFPVTGMSCAACAMNVERMLKRQAGVINVSVNYANASARVEIAPEGIDALSVQSAIRSIGYDIHIQEPELYNKDEEQRLRYKQLKTNMIGSLILALPIMILSMFFMNPTNEWDGIPFTNLIMLGLTAPVLVWFGKGFFINAYKLARHGQTNMDTLVALSTGIAFIFSLFTTLYPKFWLNRGLQPHVYYEASAVVIAFILVGKVLEERAKSKTSAAIKKLMGLQPTMATRVDETGVVVTADHQQQMDALQKEAHTVICLASDTNLLAMIALTDRLKNTSADAIRKLQFTGLDVCMLTGDNWKTAETVARQAGITTYKANMMPSDKANFISTLQSEGKTVAMIGDGINDSQAMAQANISIAMGKGSDIAMDVADMTIISSDLRQVAKAIRLSRLTARTIHQNLFWAFVYNLIGIPIAAGILYPVWGFTLNPMIAAAAMAMSSVSVVGNSLRIRRKRL